MFLHDCLPHRTEMALAPSSGDLLELALRENADVENFRPRSSFCSDATGCSYAFRIPIQPGAVDKTMNTRSLAARLKRLEFRLDPGFVRPQIVICAVDSKAQTLYKMRLGPGGNQYFSVENKPITKEEADQLSAASEKAMPF